jgi:hypothetical protein
MYITSLGFVEAKSDTSLFVFRRGTVQALIASSAAFLQQTISALKREFITKDLGPLYHFLGVSVQHEADGLFLTQRQFALDILERVSMVDCKPVSTPVDMQAKVSVEFRPPIVDPTHFRNLAKALRYLTFTVPTLPTSFNRFASTCMIHVSPTSPP